MIRVSEAVERITQEIGISQTSFYTYLKKYEIDTIKEGKYKYLRDEDYSRLVDFLTGKAEREIASDDAFDSQINLLRQTIEKQDHDIDYFKKLIDEQDIKYKKDVEKIKEKTEKDIDYFKDELRHKDDSYMELLRVKDTQITALDGKIQNFQGMLFQRESKILQLQEDTESKDIEIARLKVKLEEIENRSILKKIKKLFSK